jgi:hypothetical protein
MARLLAGGWQQLSVCAAGLPRRPIETLRVQDPARPIRWPAGLRAAHVPSSIEDIREEFAFEAPKYLLLVLLPLRAGQSSGEVRI